MFKSLYAKIALLFSLLFILAATAFVTLSFVATQKYDQEGNQRLHRKLASYLVSNNLFISNGSIHHQALKESFEVLMHINPQLELYLLNPKGSILAFAASLGKVKRTEVAMEPLLQYLEPSTTFPIYGDDPRNLEGHKVFSVSPIPAEGALEGYLYVILGGEDHDSIVSMLRTSYISRLSTWIVIGGTFFLLLTGLILFRSLTTPLRQLAAAMAAFETSDFRKPVHLASRRLPIDGDEIDRLSAIFNGMAKRMMELIDRLQSADRLRQEMITNVSHDLRTPLAALRGYLETLQLKREKLGDKQISDYLNMATRRAEGLGRLVDELFELAKLEPKETQIHQEPFQIAELIQDIIQKTVVLAEKQGIDLRTDSIGPLPYVEADIGLIERAVQNLIDNALRYTPKGGVVTVSLKPEYSTVRVSISDTGCGIPIEEQAYVFERYYRDSRDTSQATRGGAGLGLAIAKRIIELHGSDIRVESAPQGGATFIFHLPLFKTTHPTIPTKEHGPRVDAASVNVTM